MTQAIPNRQMTILIVGDAIVLLAVTLIGFASHDLSLGNPRILATFLPLVLAWWVVSPWLGLYTRRGFARPDSLWRPALAALIAAPLAMLLRGLWLGSAIIPIFVLVMAGVSAVGLALWRLVWSFVSR